MAWSKTPFGQTLDHLIHQPILIFGGNRREGETGLYSPFVLMRNNIYSGLREASV